MGVYPVAPLDLASGLACFDEGGACLREGTARKLQMPRICSGSARAGLSGARCLEEPGIRPEGSDPEDDDERMGLDLNDESEALLNFLNARRRVAKSLFLSLLSFFSFSFSHSLTKKNLLT